MTADEGIRVDTTAERLAARGTPAKAPRKPRSAAPAPAKE